MRYITYKQASEEFDRYLDNSITNPIKIMELEYKASSTLKKIDLTSYSLLLKDWLVKKNLTTDESEEGIKG